MLKTQDLDFTYPAELIAIKPQYPPRVMQWGSMDGALRSEPIEITFNDLLLSIPEGDLLIVNNTRVLPRKIKVNGLEILFIEKLHSQPLEAWSVLMPSQKMKVGDEITLPQGVTLKLSEKGLPQKVTTNKSLTDEYFAEWGSLALPPYILKQRQELASGQEKSNHEKSNQENSSGQFADEEWYQPLWQKVLEIKGQKDGQGSLASPTASLHFKDHDFELLNQRGVKILPVTLHVGLGTFLPIKTEKLSEHQMHFEWVEIPKSTWEEIWRAKKQGRKIWALGTTVARSLESAAQGILNEHTNSSSGIAYSGRTNLFIQPGFDWQIVDRLLTNFHQPQSTLLALVASIAGLNQTLQAYDWAIKKRFRLFSYGDFSLWIRK